MTYTLAREQDNPPLWVLRQATKPAGNGHPGGTSLGVCDLASQGAAQSWATRLLYGHETRVLHWEPFDDTTGRAGLARAVTGPVHGQWEICQYMARSRRVYTQTPTGAWDTFDGPTYPTLEALEASDGPLLPLDVTNLPALLAEIGVYRAVAGYLDGPQACLGGNCPDGPAPTGCTHVRLRIASAARLAETYIPAVHCG